MTTIDIVVPVYDVLSPCFTSSLINALTMSNNTLTFKPLYSVAMVRKARNILAHRFLNNSTSEWMLMTDADMSFSINDINTLLSRQKMVIGGLYRKRANASNPYVLNTLDGKAFDPNVAKVQEVKYVGTGFMLIHRSVFQAIKDSTFDVNLTYKDLDISPLPIYDFFWEGVKDNQLLSCDWGFCQRVRDARIPVYVDCGTSLQHSGTTMF